MSEICEIVMLLCFGASWPLNVIKSYRARSTKGKSLWFLILIIIGYIAGVVAKFTNPTYMAEISKKWYVLFFYFLNMAMVSLDVAMYFRNKHLESNKIK